LAGLLSVKSILLHLEFTYFMRILLIVSLLFPGILLSTSSQDPYRKTIISFGAFAGNYNLDPINRLLAQNNYKPIPENWKYFCMSVRRNLLKSPNYVFVTYGISPNFDYYEASLNQVDNKYLNVSIGFLQMGWSRDIPIGKKISVLPLIGYRSDIITMGYGQLSGSLGKNLQNPQPGQRSTGFIFSIVSGVSLERMFYLSKFPSPNAPLRFLLGLSIQSGIPVSRHYWYSNYSSLSGERFHNRLCGGLSLSFHL